jgi:hypothetical protein
MSAVWVMVILLLLALLLLWRLGFVEMVQDVFIRLGGAPKWVWFPLGLGLICALAFIYGITLPKVAEATGSQSITGPYTGPTRLNLAFQSDMEIPRVAGRANVFRWFILRTDVRTTGATALRESVGSTLFVVFERPVTSTDAHVEVTFVGACRPPYEVKDFSQRSMVVVFDGIISNCSIEISIRDAPVDAQR